MNYRAITRLLERYVRHDTLFKWGFNLSPMFRRTTARIEQVSADLQQIRVHLPISWKNRNYVGSIFGGSLFSAVDPIPMVQLMRLLGEDYVVWDKSAEIQFRRPAREDVFADFTYTPAELARIRAQVAADGETVWDKETELRGRDGQTLYCVVNKRLYVASKAHYRAKLQARGLKDASAS